MPNAISWVVVSLLLHGGAVYVLAGQDAGPTKPQVEGVTSFTRLDATMGCAGLTKASAIPDLKRLGFKSVVNLQLANEQGADVEGERRAAENAGVRYFHLPLDLVSQPTPEQAEAARRVARAFLELVREPGNQPMFVHCSGAGRSAALWMVKRIVIDGWSVDRARAEAVVAYPGKGTFAFDWAASVAANR